MATLLQANLARAHVRYARPAVAAQPQDAEGAGLATARHGGWYNAHAVPRLSAIYVFTDGKTPAVLTVDLASPYTVRSYSSESDFVDRVIKPEYATFTAVASLATLADGAWTKTIVGG